MPIINYKIFNLVLLILLPLWLWFPFIYPLMQIYLTMIGLVFANLILWLSTQSDLDKKIKNSIPAIVLNVMTINLVSLFWFYIEISISNSDLSRLSSFGGLIWIFSLILNLVILPLIVIILGIKKCKSNFS